MGQVIRLLREGHELHVVGDGVLTKIDELPTEYLLEALGCCKKVRQQMIVLLELAAHAETMIDRVECHATRHQLYEQQGSSRMALTAALGRISTAIHALNVALLRRRRSDDPKKL